MFFYRNERRVVSRWFGFRVERGGDLIEVIFSWVIFFIVEFFENYFYCYLYVWFILLGLLGIIKVFSCECLVVIF